MSQQVQPRHLGNAMATWKTFTYGNLLGAVIEEIFDFWALSVEILVFTSPTGYMLTSSSFLLLNWGIFL